MLVEVRCSRWGIERRRPPALAGGVGAWVNGSFYVTSECIRLSKSVHWLILDFCLNRLVGVTGQYATGVHVYRHGRWHTPHVGNLIPEPRGQPVIAAIDDRSFLIFGGYSLNQSGIQIRLLVNLWRFDTVELRWETISNRNAHLATAFNTTERYVCRNSGLRQEYPADECPSGWGTNYVSRYRACSTVFKHDDGSIGWILHGGT